MSELVTVWVEYNSSGLRVMRELGYHRHPAFPRSSNSGRHLDAWQVPAEDVEALKGLLAEVGAYFQP